MAVLDEIQRLVPGYDVSRLGLLAGNDQHDSTGEHSTGGDSEPSGMDRSLAVTTLFTSGTLGRYSKTLNSVIENEPQARVDSEVVAD